MLIYACPDLFFASRIRGTADRLGIASAPAPDPGRLLAALETRAAHPPRALFVDLAMAEAPELIELAVSYALPVVAFGPHVDTDRLEAARLAGAARVLARSRFTKELPELIRQYGAADPDAPNP